MRSSRQEPRIVVVDDEDAVGELMGFILRRAGYDASVVHDGKAGLALCDTAQPDLVITDIVMPDMEGIEFLRRLRQTRAGTPAIAMSGHPVGASFLEAARLLGAREVLQKPISEATLLSAVRTVLTDAGGVPPEVGMAD
ncbi:MAG: response regulator, partial [Spirochaetales bacterium]|nr:response regulator [Spirochaetales bacterium]